MSSGVTRIVSVGPLLWAPLSEFYGRQPLYGITFAGITLFNVGTALAHNIQTLLILRFFAGAFGVSIMTNSGGTVADLFTASERGLAMIVLSFPAFMGPVLGPIIGGFVAETIGWRWLQGLQAIATGSMWLVFVFCIPETYGPVILRMRAKRMRKATDLIYKSIMDTEKKPGSLANALRIALSRPWALLLREPIVLLLSIYLAIVYGTLYLLFEAFPVVYQKGKCISDLALCIY
jgi:MFS family permease